MWEKRKGWVQGALRGYMLWDEMRLEGEMKRNLKVLDTSRLTFLFEYHSFGIFHVVVHQYYYAIIFYYQTMLQRV